MWGGAPNASKRRHGRAADRQRRPQRVERSCVSFETAPACFRRFIDRRAFYLRSAQPDPPAGAVRSGCTANMAARAGECKPRRTRSLAMTPARKRGPGRAKLQGDRNAGRLQGDTEHPGGAFQARTVGRAKAERSEVVRSNPCDTHGWTGESRTQ